MSIMAIKLFAHVLREIASAEGVATPAAIRSLDLGRWRFRELVVRRSDPAAWAWPRAPQAGDARVPRRASAAEPLWADTQPWCHE